MGRRQVLFGHPIIGLARRRQTIAAKPVARLEMAVRVAQSAVIPMRLRERKMKEDAVVVLGIAGFKQPLQMLDRRRIKWIDADNRAGPTVERVDRMRPRQRRDAHVGADLENSKRRRPIRKEIDRCRHEDLPLRRVRALQGPRGAGHRLLFEVGDGVADEVIFGIEGEGLIERRLGCRNIAFCVPYQTHIGEDAGAVRIQRQRLAENGKRFGVPSQLKLDHAGVVERLEVFGLAPQYFRQPPCRLRQLTAAKILEGRIQIAVCHQLSTPNGAQWRPRNVEPSAVFG